MADKDNEQIVFDMLEEVATESIAIAKDAYTYDDIEDCYVKAKEIADKVRMILAKNNTSTLDVEVRILRLIALL